MLYTFVPLYVSHVDNLGERVNPEVHYLERVHLVLDIHQQSKEKKIISKIDGKQIGIYKYRKIIYFDVEVST